MTKKNVTNGNGKAKAPPAPTPPLAEDEALAIAHGAAASAFDFLSSRRAADTDTLPHGRFWYSGGDVEAPEETHRHLAELKDFVLAHPGAPASSAYVHLTRDVMRRRPSAWSDLSLAQRQAFAVFASVLPPLVKEARREAKRLEAEAEPAEAPLPNRGIFRRTIGDRASNAAVRGHFSHDQKGAVDRG